MTSFGKSLRKTVSALGLGVLSSAALIAVAISTADAQQPKPPPAKKEFANPFNAAVKAAQASNWADAIAQSDAAEPFAENDDQRCSIAKLRTSVGAQASNKPVLIKGLEVYSNCPGQDPKVVAAEREALVKAYSESPGSEDKGEAVVKAHMADSSPWALNWAANRALERKDFDTAVALADAGIAASKATGQKVAAAFYNIKINAYTLSKQDAKVFPVLEEVAPLYPTPPERYFRPLIDRAKTDAKYDRKAIGLDVYRAYIAAGIKLANDEQAFMGDLALGRGLAIEGEKVMTPLVQSNWVGGAEDKNGAYNKKTYATLQTNAKQDRDGGLAQSEKEAAKAPNGNLYIATGESYFGLEDYAKAATLIQQGLDKGGLKPADEAMAKLHLGIAQFKAGQKDAARATWASITSDDGSQSLAHAWIAISRI